MKFAQFKNELDAIVNARGMFAGLLKSSTGYEVLSPDIEKQNEFKDLIPDIANYNLGPEILKLRAEEQAKTIYAIKKKIEEERKVADNLKKFSDLYDQLEKLCDEALYEPAVFESFRKVAQADTYNDLMVSQGANPAKVRDFAFTLDQANALTIGGEVVAQNDKIATKITYKQDGANNSTLDQFLQDLNAYVAAPNFNPSEHVIDLGVAVDPTLEVVAGGPDPLAAFGNNERWPLRGGKPFYKKSFDDARTQYIVPKGFKVEQNGAGNFFLRPDLDSTVSKFHYVLQQTQMMREQFVAQINAGNNVDDNRKRIKRINLFESNLIAETLIQAYANDDKELFDAVEQYQYERIGRNLLNELAVNPNVGVAGNPFNKLNELMRNISDRNVFPDLSEAHRIGLMHKSIIAVMLEYTNDAEFKKLAVKYLIQIQGLEGALFLLDKLNGTKFKDDSPHAFSLTSAELNTILTANPTLRQEPGLRSEPVKKAMQETLELVELKSLAKNVTKDAEKINAAKIKAKAVSLSDAIPEWYENHNVGGAAVSMPWCQPDRSLLNTEAVKTTFLDLVKKLNGTRKKSNLALMASAGIFKAGDTKNLANKYYTQARNLATESDKVKQVMTNESGARWSKDLSEKLTDNVNSGYLSFLKFGKQNHKNQAIQLRTDLAYLNDRGTTVANIRARINNVTPVVDAAKLEKALTDSGYIIAEHENDPIPKEVIFKAMLQLILNEATRVVNDKGPHYGGKHGALKHGFLGRNGSDYLYGTLLHTLNQFENVMPLEIKAKYFALQQKMDLIAYQDGFGHYGKPGRGKKEWSTAILNEIELVEYQMQNNFDAVKAADIAALTGAANKVAFDALAAPVNKKELETLLRLHGYKGDEASFATAKPLALAALNDFKKLDGGEALRNLRSVYEKHIHYLTLHYKTLVGGEELLKTLKARLKEFADTNESYRERLEAIESRASVARSRGDKVADAVYDQLQVEDKHRRKNR